MSKESLAPSDRGPSQVRWIDVAEEEAGQRIDNYLAARLKGVPKSLIYRILRSARYELSADAESSLKRIRRKGCAGYGVGFFVRHLLRSGWSDCDRSS